MNVVVKKYCSGCQQLRHPEQGKLVRRGKINRWICTFCLAKTNVSMYTRKDK